MATTDSDRTEPQPGALDEQSIARKLDLKRVPRLAWWAAGVTLVVVVLIVSLAAWGPGMDYPTKVSTNEISTASGSTVEVERSVRDVTGTAIDDAVDWITVEGKGLFKGLSTGVTHALINIEKLLKWLPWPAVVLRVGAGVLRRWALASAGVHSPGLALYWLHGPVGKHCRHHRSDGRGSGPLRGRWISPGRPGRPQPESGQHHAPNPRRHADHAQLCLPASRHNFLWPGKAGGDFRHHHLRCPSGHTPDQPGNPAGFRRDRGSSPFLRRIPCADLDQGTGADGVADYHGRGEPDHHDGPGNGDNRQHGRGGGAWETTSCGRCRRTNPATGLSRAYP